MALNLNLNCFDDRVLQVLDALTLEVWICIFKDTTSPIVILIGLDREVLNRGIGNVGYVAIPQFILGFVAPEDISAVSSRDLGLVSAISEEGLTS